jgi:hypothetical protein
MGLFAVHTLHHRARCDACGHLSDVLCGENLQTARYSAITSLQTKGWRHRVPASERPRTRGWVEMEGAGEWLCPLCV